MLKQLGKYRIDSVLGKGAMGTVYKAYDPNIARTVALKTIRKELFGDSQHAELVSRFNRAAVSAGHSASRSCTHKGGTPASVVASTRSTAFTTSRATR